MLHQVNKLLKIASNLSYIKQDLNKRNNKRTEKWWCNTTTNAPSGLSAVNSQCHVSMLLNHTDACTQAQCDAQKHTHAHPPHTHTLPPSIYCEQLKVRTCDAHALIHTYFFFPKTKGRADCNIFLHFKKVASVKMINEGSWGRACILTLDCTRASRAAAVFRAAFRLLLLHTTSQRANYEARQWLAVWN